MVYDQLLALSFVRLEHGDCIQINIALTRPTERRLGAARCCESI